MRVATGAIEVTHDKERNASEIARRIEEAAEQGAELLVLPEASLQGYMYDINSEVTTEELQFHYEQAEPLDGPTVLSLAAVARDHNLHVIFGMTERADAVLYNTAALCTPTGTVHGFRKAHLGGSELHIFERGTKVKTLLTSIGRIGVNICYDICFPEVARTHALAGAELLIFPNAWPVPDGADETDPRLMPFMLLPRIRAWENQCYVIVANICGRADVGQVNYYGHSRIIDPVGTVIADTGPGPGLSFADIDLHAGILDARTGPFFGYNMLKDRQPDVYAALNEPHPFEPDA